MKKGLKQIENDVVFINPETGEADCTYNSCAANFTIKGEEERFVTDYWADGTPIPYTFYYRKCNKCDRQISTDTEKRKTLKSRQDATKKSYDEYQEKRKKKLREMRESVSS